MRDMSNSRALSRIESPAPFISQISFVIPTVSKVLRHLREKSADDAAATRWVSSTLLLLHIPRWTDRTGTRRSEEDRLEYDGHHAPTVPTRRHIEHVEDFRRFASAR